MNMKKMNRITSFVNVVIVSFLFSNSLLADTTTGENISSVGTDVNGTRVEVVVTPNKGNCLGGKIYYEDSAEQSRTLAIALAAKMAAKTVRIDYIKDGSVCWGSSIFVE